MNNAECSKVREMTRYCSRGLVKEDILPAFKVKGWNAETKTALSFESDVPPGTVAIVSWSRLIKKNGIGQINIFCGKLCRHVGPKQII